MNSAFETGVYPNRFLSLGVTEEQVEERKNQIFETIFYGSEAERFYHEAGDDMGYMEDTGNHDARTEGMSYGMMMCVQMNRKEEFDRLWKWARTYMYMDKGPNAGYFCWSNAVDGKKNAMGAAPDGEEYFAMTLFFASHRWGDGEGIFNYSEEAKSLLHRMIAPDDPKTKQRAMFDADNHYIRFIAEVDFSDPSYHLPHFYELWAKWAREEDRPFFAEAAKASREYLAKACHPDTGLSAEYAEYDGSPHEWDNMPWGRHDWFYSDAYRTIMNISIDGMWFGKDPWQVEEAKIYQNFFVNHPDAYRKIMMIDGEVLAEDVLHPVAIIATTATASLLNDDEAAKKCLLDFWNTPLRSGDRRYYDNCLYFFAFLALSGNYRIY